MATGRNLGQAIGVAALVCATFGVSTASAQVDYEIMASLQFNFSNPGARSLAMAGALTGAGDDATGAWTNPGGLTNITRPEVGVEFRGFGFETPFVTSGHFNGTPTQIGIDTVNGLIYGKTDNSTHSLSFVSAVVPKSRFAFAVYRTEVANFEADIQTVGAVLRGAHRHALLRVETRSLPPCLPDRRQPRPPDLELRRIGGGASDRSGVGRRRRLVLRLRDQFGEPPLRTGREPEYRTGRLLRAAVVRRVERGRHRVHRGRGFGIRPEHRGVDQPERHVPHRRQLPPGAEVRHRPPARGLRRHADWRHREQVRACPTSLPSACWSSRCPR